MKCLTELFTLLAVLPLALALNVFQCLDLWRRSNVKHESNDLHKYCMDGFIEGVPANKIDKNVNNYLNSLLRKKIGESFHTVNRVKRQTNRRPLPQGRRRPQAQNTRQPIRQSFQRSVTQSARLQGRFPPDRVRHEVRSPNYDMVWGRFANRTQRLANFSVSKDILNTF